jgi:hypothetical protein
MNYIELAMRTNSTTVGTHGVSPDLLHAALGMVDEVNEVGQALDKHDLTNLIEEVGDLCWFIALAGNALGHDPFSARSNMQLENITPPPMVIAEFVGLVKKCYAYGKPLPIDTLATMLDTLVLGCRATIDAMAESTNGITLEMVLAGNIAKLQTRYPDKFTAAHALNRDIAAEMRAMGSQLQ